jgi:hypothetical protein
VFEYVVWLDGIARYQLHKHCLMDCIGRETDHQQLELTINNGAVSATGCQVETWGQKVERTILMRDVKDLVLDVDSGQCVEVGGAKPRRELVSTPRTIDKVTRALGKLDIILPPKDHIRSWICGGGDSEVGKIQLKLDPDEFDARRSIISHVAILNRQ